jgi:hypothetical protein
MLRVEAVGIGKTENKQFGDKETRKRNGRTEVITSLMERSIELL